MHISIIAMRATRDVSGDGTRGPRRWRLRPPGSSPGLARRRVDKLSDWFSLIKKARVSAEGGGAIDGVCHARLLLPRAGGAVANGGRGHASTAATWAASAEAPGLRWPLPANCNAWYLIFSECGIRMWFLCGRLIWWCSRAIMKGNMVWCRLCHTKALL